MTIDADIVAKRERLTQLREEIAAANAANAVEASEAAKEHQLRALSREERVLMEELQSVRASAQIQEQERAAARGDEVQDVRSTDAAEIMPTPERESAALTEDPSVVVAEGNLLVNEDQPVTPDTAAAIEGQQAPAAATPNQRRR